MDPVRTALTTAGAALLLTLTACGSGGGSGLYGSGSSSSTTPSASGSGSTGTSATGLTSASTSLGTVVVDTSGRTVYVFDKDSKGATSSICTGICAQQWPAVPAGKASSSVTGMLGSITGVDGKAQATLDGWPLYYYAGDAGAGDVMGQGIGGIWWVVTPAGVKVTTAPGSTGGSSTGSSSGSSSGSSTGGRGGY